MSAMEGHAEPTHGYPGGGDQREQHRGIGLRTSKRVPQPGRNRRQQMFAGERRHRQQIEKRKPQTELTDRLDNCKYGL
jgi:hypothetical protein